MNRAPTRIRESGERSWTYSSSGVDTRSQDAAISRFTEGLRSTWGAERGGLLDFGHFANIVRFGDVGVAISTDGVGTKALIAQIMDRYDTIGIDCVAMNVNDVLCVGAEPQSMVDYIAVESLNQSMLDQILEGLIKGARLANVAMVGGETAQLPDAVKGEGPGIGFDLAGTCIGTVGPDRIVSGDRIQPGDSIIGLLSSGIHSNGLTLARRVFGLTTDVSLKDKRDILSTYYAEIDSTLGDELLKPTRIYVREVLEMAKSRVDVRGLAHITTDGFLNLPRLSADVGYRIDRLPEPHPIFGLIESHGSVPDTEMYDVFNMGIGMCVVVSTDHESKAIELCREQGTEAFAIGQVVDDKDRAVEILPRGLAGRRGEGFSRTD